MKRYFAAFMISFTITLVVGYIVTSFNIDRSIPGSPTIELVGRCELIYFSTSLQPVNTLVIACPGMDYFRLWPLPITHPWFEHPWYDNPDALNG